MSEIHELTGFVERYRIQSCKGVSMASMAKFLRSISTCVVVLLVCGISAYAQGEAADPGQAQNKKLSKDQKQKIKRT